MNIVRYNRRWPELWADNWFDRWAHGAFAPIDAAQAEQTEQAWAPRVDIQDKGDAIVLNAELPGVEPDGLKVEVHDGVLTLRGEKRREESKEEAGFFRTERVYGSFERRFTLPDTVDPDRIDAEYKDGVLRMSLPKRPEVAPKQIAIKNAAGASAQIGVS